MPDRRDREIALGPVDDRSRHDRTADSLEHSLAARRELQLGRTGRRELDELVIKERGTRLQTGSHGHIVNPLDGIFHQHDHRVDAQRRVQRAGRTGLGEVGGDERRADIGVKQVVRLDHGLDRAVRPVREHPQVVLDRIVASDPGQRRVPGVTGEYLVRTLPGLHDLQVAGDLLRQQVEGDAVVADHRLAHRVDGRLDRGQQPVTGDPNLVMVGAEMVRNDVGVRELVTGLAAGRLEADTERREIALPGLGQQGHDEAGVKPPGQEHTDADVGDHAPAHRGA